MTALLKLVETVALLTAAWLGAVIVVLAVLLGWAVWQGAETEKHEKPAGVRTT